MSQPSKKQIKAQLTNEMAKKYEQRLKDKDGLIDHWSNKYFERDRQYHELLKSKDDLTAENQELKSQIEQYKDWIERMQEFCNLPESEREGAVRTYIESIKSQKLASDAFNHINSMFGHFFGIGLGL